MPIRKFAPALLSLFLLASAQATAQPIPATASCFVGGQRGTGITQIATGCPIGRAPALSAFRFGFFNGEHRFRHLEIMPQGETFEAAFEDSGGEDPYFVEGRWIVFPNAPGGIVTAVVQGVADIPIPAGPADSTLVLSGFEFRRADGTDNNIRTIAIQLDGARHMVRTVLLDDQGTDYTNLATAIAAGFLFGAAGAPDPSLSMLATSTTGSLLHRGTQTLTPGAPVYEAIQAPAAAAAAAAAPATPAAPFTISPGVLNGAIIRPGTFALLTPPAVKVSDTNARPYQVRVAYLWVPNARLTNTRTVSGSGRSRSETSGSLPTSPRHVLQGFSFHFGNSDHFIADFGVHLTGGAPVQTTIPANEVVSWEDANRDDPIQWRVRFSDVVALAGRH